MKKLLIIFSNLFEFDKLNNIYIKNYKSCAYICAKVCDILLNNYFSASVYQKAIDSIDNCQLLVSTMNHSRIFINGNNRKYSICFPLTIIVDDFNNKINNITIKYGEQELDSFTISKALSYFNDEINDKNEFSNDFINFLSNVEWSFIRYEKDEEHHSEKHPLYHLDINWSNRTTYKIGLHDKYSLREFRDFLDNSKIIKYIENKCF